MCIIMVCQFPVFFRITEPDSQVLPLRLRERPYGIICRKHLLREVQIPAVFLQDFPHKAVQICHLHIKAPVTEIRHRCVFPKYQHIMLIIFAMTDTATLKRLLPQIFIIRGFQHSCRFFSFLQKPFHAFQIIFLKRIDRSFFSDKTAYFFHFLIMPDIFFLQISSRIIHFHRKLHDLVDLCQSPDAF